MAPAAMPEAASRTAKRSAVLRRHHAAAGVQQQHVAVVAARLEALLAAAARSRRRAAQSTAFATVVEKRSCSKISGSTSLDVETFTPGSSSSRIARMRSSFSRLA